MNRSTPWLLLVTILAGTCGSAASAAKITIDPNVSAPRSATPSQDGTDPRALQKVTCELGYTRLHIVAEELSEKTGVTIRAGQNKQDWRVRDIPLIVCVKDMPLGRLLRALAAAAHVQLRAERVAGVKDEPTYRLLRDKKSQEAVLSVLDRREQVNLDLAAWAWDALLAYASRPGLPVTDPEDPGVQDQTRLISKLLASLGPEGKTKVIGGESITLSCPLSDLARELFLYACAQPSSEGKPADPTEQDIQNGAVTVRIGRIRAGDYVAGGFSISVPSRPVLIGTDRLRTIDSWTVDAVALAKAVAKVEDLRIPPAPEVDAYSKAASRPDDPGLKPVETEEDWKQPLLQARALVEAPKEKGGLTRACVVPGIAKSGRLSIICEDFSSHKLAWESSVTVATEKQISVSEALKGLSPDKYHQMAWFADADSKLLVGWQDDWRKHHQDLVPESLLAGIRSKREGKGAEIDDVVPLLALTDGQYREWVRSTKDFPDGSGYVQPVDRPFWLLYNALGPEDKLLAKSDAGLPLAKLDPAWVCGFFEQERSSMENELARLQTYGDSAERKDKLVFLRDPSPLSELTMRVKRSALDRWQVQYWRSDGLMGLMSCATRPNKVEKHAYTVELAGVRNDSKFRVTAQWQRMQFPLFTFAREAELGRQAVAPGWGEPPLMHTGPEVVGP